MKQTTEASITTIPGTNLLSIKGKEAMNNGGSRLGRIGKGQKGQKGFKNCFKRLKGSKRSIKIGLRV